MSNIQLNNENNSGNFLTKLVAEHGFLKFCKQLIEENGCIDWNDFASKLYRRSHSVGTLDIYLRGCWYFAEFTKKNATKNLCEVIKMPQEDILKLLDRYVTEQDTLGVSARTIESRITGVRKLLKYVGIKIDNGDFREKVVMPRKMAIRDEIPTNEQIRAILNQASPAMRAYVLVLCDSGLSSGDALRLRVKDFKFEESPVRILARRSKTGTDHETFITDETAALLKQRIWRKKFSPDSYIFAKNVGKRTADNLRARYKDTLKKAGLAEKIEGHRFYKFHLHVYRKRWFTRAINVVPAYVAHAMLGRKQYLDEYLRLTQEERGTLYKKIARHVSVFESKTEKAELLAEASRLLGVELTEEKLQALKSVMNEFMRLGDRDLERLKKTIVKGKGHKKHSRVSVANVSGAQK